MSEAVEKLAGVGRRGLIPVQKTITREGKSFEQRYWVKAADVRRSLDDARKNKKDKKAFRKAFTESIDQLGGDFHQASYMMSDWTDGVDYSGALEFRGAVLKNFAVFNHDSAITRDAERLGVWDDRITKGAEYASTAKAIADASQAMYDEEMVTLYRGVQLPERPTPGEANLKVDHLTCFSESPHVASRFAKHKEAKHGAVYKVTVPRSSIAASYRAVPDMDEIGEQEVVVVTHGMVRGEILEAR